jgi:hypothetical protein
MRKEQSLNFTMSQQLHRLLSLQAFPPTPALAREAPNLVRGTEMEEENTGRKEMALALNRE